MELVMVMVEQTALVSFGLSLFTFSLSPIITLCWVFRMVESDKIKNAEYEAMKAIRDAEHVKFVNEYYANRDTKRAEWLKAIESWSIVETSV